MGLPHSTILNMLVEGVVKFVVDRSFVVRFGFSRLFRKGIFRKDLDDVLDSSVDVVYITTPTQSHYFLLKRVLSRGVRAVFVKKPPTTNCEQLENLIGSVGVGSR